MSGSAQDESDSATTGGAVRLGVLGPLEVLISGRTVRITAKRERALLTALLARPGATVSTGQLAEVVWPESEQPARPANQIAICVLSLRRRLAAAGAPEDLLVTRAPGYLVRLASVRLDTEVARARACRARELAAAGRRTEALSALRAALSCWRGTVFGGIERGWLGTEAVRWAELRAALQDECVQLELELGGHERVIGELSVLVAGQGLRERPREQLMIALSRAGRPAQALDVYRVTRRMFADQLGIDPSARLRRLHDDIVAALDRGDLTGVPAPRTADQHRGAGR